MTTEASQTPNIDYLKGKAWQLHTLLNDPHPGLMTWIEAYRKIMQEIMDFWNADTEIQQAADFLIEYEKTVTYPSYPQISLSRCEQSGLTLAKHIKGIRT